MLRSRKRVPTGERRALRGMRIPLGTGVAIEAVASSEMLAACAIEAAFEAVTAVEHRMHPSRAGSDVARINAAPVGTRTPIHPSTAEVLRLALPLNEPTDLLFDPCLPVRPARLTDLELHESAGAGGAAWVIAHAPVA